jgi:ribosome biogenesis GTPase A
MGYWPLTKRVVKDSDIVLLVADVRMPKLSINKELLKMAKYYRRKLILVFNKKDLVSSKYLNFVKKEYGNSYFVSGVKNEGINELKRNLKIIGKRLGIKVPRIGVVGYPNVGKSAIINALAKRGKTKVSKMAGTTKGIQWVKAGGLYVLDSPGVVPFSDREVDLGVMGAKNPEKLRNSAKVAWKIIGMFRDYDIGILEKVYGISVEGMDVNEVVEEIGKKKGFLLKGGQIDEERSILLVIRDWQKGKLRL